MDCEPEINWANLRSSLQALIYHKSLETERNEAVGGGLGKWKVTGTKPSRAGTQAVFQRTNQIQQFSNSQLHRILNVAARFPGLSTCLFVCFITFSTHSTSQFYI